MIEIIIEVAFLVVLPALFTYAVGSLIIQTREAEKNRKEFYPRMKVGDKVIFYVDRTHLTGKISKIEDNVKMKDGTSEDLVTIEVLQYKSRVYPIKETK